MADRSLKRTKTSAAVVDHLLGALFEGTLRTGDRVDIDDVAGTLGISRSPVREALVILERDGIVSTRYHRGVYVEPFGADSIMDHFEVYGVLSSIAVQRLARRPEPETLAELGRLLDELQQTPPDQTDRTNELVRQLLRTQHRAGGSPRLLAELRTFAGFLPWVFRAAGGRSHDSIVRGQAGVVGAIAAGDPERAARARIEDIEATGREVARELAQRGILGQPARPE